MEKRIIGVYRVELNDSCTYLARTKFDGAYVHAVSDDVNGYAVLPDRFDMILVDTYSVYSL